jgi:hypothetical protein
MNSWFVDATPGSNLAHENAHGICAFCLSGPMSWCSSKINAKYLKKNPSKRQKLHAQKMAKAGIPCHVIKF